MHEEYWGPPVRMDSGVFCHSSMVFLSWARASCTCRPCRSSCIGMSFRSLFLHRQQLTFNWWKPAGRPDHHSRILTWRTDTQGMTAQAAGESVAEAPRWGSYFAL